MEIAATHSRPVVFEAVFTYCAAIQTLINTGDSQKAFEEIKKMNFPWFKEYIEEQKKLSPSDKAHIGWAKCAWYYAFTYLRDKKSLSDTLIGCVLERGDTDTDAAIAGAMIGAI